MSKTVRTSQTIFAKEPTRQRVGFTGSIVTGFAALLTLTGPSTISAHSKGISPTNSLRGDFARIGADMRSVIVKERKGEKNSR